MLAREGPHIEVVTWAFVKLTPWSTSNFLTFGITVVPSQRSSSLRITTTLSRWSTRWLYRAEGLPAEAPTAPKTSSNAAPTQIHTTLRTGSKVALLVKRCLRLPKAFLIDTEAEDTEPVGLSVTTRSAMRITTQAPEIRTGASLGETGRKWKGPTVLVPDGRRPHVRLLLQPQHRLDVQPAHDVHVGTWIVPPRGRQGVPQPGPGGAFAFPVLEEAVVDHRSGYVGTGRQVL